MFGDDSSIRAAQERYHGPLTPGQAAEGINAAVRNARRLAADARLLLDAGRFPSAASIAALAIEEAGKPHLIRNLLGAATPSSLKVAWKQYRNHRSKNGMWILPLLARAGARHLSQLGAVADPNEPHTAMLDSFKQLGFYSDCYGDCHWSEPSDTVEAPAAETLVRTAEMLCKIREVSVRELELWVEIVVPTLDTPAAHLAVIEWQRAMFEEGLSDTNPEEMAAFVLPENARPH